MSPKKPGYPGSCTYLSLAAARDAYEQASRETGVSVDEMLSDSRQKRITQARWAVMRIMRARNASVQMIGKRMQLNHATVIYGLRQT